MKLAFFLRLKNNLSEGYAGQIFARFVINNRYLFAGSDHHGNIIERHIAAALGVIELTVCISFYNFCGRHGAMVTHRINEGQTTNSILTFSGFKRIKSAIPRDRQPNVMHRYL